jgi:hypothetical protein
MLPDVSFPYRTMLWDPSESPANVVLPEIVTFACESKLYPCQDNSSLTVKVKAIGAAE